MLNPLWTMKLTQKTRIKACQTRMGMTSECLGCASDTFLASGLLTYPGFHDRVPSLGVCNGRAMEGACSAYFNHR